MPPTDHARFSPSSSGRWLLCPYSVPQEGYPPERPSGEQAERGRRMHAQAERHLLANTDPAKERFPLVYTSPESGREAKIPMDEWHSHVVPYVAAVRDVYDQLVICDGEPVLLVEAKLTIHADDCWGTCDAAVVSVPLAEAHVFDLKTGYHEVPACAPQFATYGIGLQRRYGSDALQRFTFHRLQAEAAKPHDTFTCDKAYLEGHYKLIVAAIKESKKGGTPGERNINPECDYCWRRASCPAHIDTATQALALLNDAPATTAPPTTLSPDKLLWFLKHKEAILRWYKALDAHLLERFAQGEPLLGYKVVEGRTKRRWSPDLDEVDIALSLAEKVPGFDPWERKLVSFTSVEKLLGKGAVDEFIIKPPGKPTIVPEDDPRPALDTGKLALLALADMKEEEEL